MVFAFSLINKYINFKVPETADAATAAAKAKATYMAAAISTADSTRPIQQVLIEKFEIPNISKRRYSSFLI